MSLMINNTDFEFFFINKNIDARGPEIFFGKGLFFLSYNCNNFVTYYNENFLAGDKSYMCLSLDDKMQSSLKDNSLNLNKPVECPDMVKTFYNKEEENEPREGHTHLRNFKTYSDKLPERDCDYKTPIEINQIYSEKPPIIDFLKASPPNSIEGGLVKTTSIGKETQNSFIDRIGSVQKP